MEQITWQRVLAFIVGAFGVWALVGAPAWVIPVALILIAIILIA